VIKLGDVRAPDCDDGGRTLCRAEMSSRPCGLQRAASSGAVLLAWEWSSPSAAREPLLVAAGSWNPSGIGPCALPGALKRRACPVHARSGNPQRPGCTVTTGGNMCEWARSPRKLRLSDVEGRPQPAARSCLSRRQTHPRVELGCGRSHEGEVDRAARAAHPGTRQEGAL
jgi:hypothetical protein